MNSLDRSANGRLDSIFLNERKQDDNLNESLKLLSRSINLNDSSKLLNSSIKSSKQIVSGFQPYNQET